MERRCIQRSNWSGKELQRTPKRLKTEIFIMNTKNFVFYGLIMWASAKFLPKEWAIAVFIALAIFCIYSIISFSMRLKRRTDFYQDDDENAPNYLPKDDYKSHLKSAIIVNSIFLLLIVGALCWPLISGGSTDDSIREEIAKVNKEGPVTVSVGGETITYHSLDYDGENIIVNIKFDSSDPDYVEMVRNKTKDAVANKAAKYSLCYDNLFKEAAMQYHKGLKAVYFFNEIGDGTTLTIPYEEIVEINNMPRSAINDILLEQYISSMNSALPDTIVDGFYASRIFIEGDYVVTVLSFDDKKLDYHDYTSTPEELKRDANNSLASSADQNDPLFMLNWLSARCGKGLIHRIKTVYSNDSIDIVNTPEEVRSTFSQYIK